MASFLLAHPAQAGLGFSLRTGDAASRIHSIPLDSNKCGTQGPRAMYVGGIVTNTGAQTETNVTAELTGLTHGFSLAGGQAARLEIGTLAPSQSAPAFWFIGYGCSMTAAASPTILLSSDLSGTSYALELRARPAISANAGGKVLGSTLGPGAVVGQTIWFDASYDFGGSDVGDEIILQPAGTAEFNAGCLRLLGSEVRASNIASIAVGTRDRVYFRQDEKQSGNGYFVDMRYFFEYLCAGTSSTARPYALQTSGSSNIKYTGNFDGAGSVSVTFPGADNPFTIVKSADRETGIAGASATVTYTVAVTNPSAYASRVTAFVDTLPVGATFAGLDPASDVTAANSSSMPAAGSSGTIVFEGNADSYAIGAGGTLRLVYRVTMPAAEGLYVNSARALFGSASSPRASAEFRVIAPLPLGLVKYSHAVWDPVNGSASPRQIPGARVGYRIEVANSNAMEASEDSIVLVDPTPANLRLHVAGPEGPVAFTDGEAPSGLSYRFESLASAADDVDFSNDGGSSWGYVPVPEADGSDPAVTHVRVRPRGAMRGSSGFALGLVYVIE